MKLDSRGDIGFLEAMVGAMAVCLVMMSFMTFLAAESFSDPDSPEEFDTVLLDYIVQSDDHYRIADTDAYLRYVDNRGLEFLEIRIYYPDSFEESITIFSTGETSSEVTIEKFLISVVTREGYSVPVIAEVVFCT